WCAPTSPRPSRNTGAVAPVNGIAWITAPERLALLRPPRRIAPSPAATRPPSTPAKIATPTLRLPDHHRGTSVGTGEFIALYGLNSLFWKSIISWGGARSLEGWKSMVFLEWFAWGWSAEQIRLYAVVMWGFTTDRKSTR